MAKDKIPHNKGYKSSPLGIIPKDWDVDYVKNLAKITTGKKDTQNKVENGLYPFYVRSKTIERINSFSYDGIAVLTAGDGVGVGKVFHYCNGKFDFHQRVYKISDFKPNIDSKYFFEYFKQNFIKEVTKATAKTSVDSVRLDMIAKMYIPLPTIAEQKKIAELFGVWSEGIETLENLIKKKERYKKALIKQLLTGKKRFKEFKGEKWKTFKLGKVCSAILDGTHQTPTYTTEGIPFYSVESITKRDFKNTKFISEIDHIEMSKRCKLQKEDILITRIGSIGDSVIIDWDVNASIYVSLALLRVNTELFDPYFVYQYTKSIQFKKEILKRSLLSAAPQKINLGDIQDIPMYIPLSKKEQKKIALVLQSADEEIECLSAQLEHSKQQKNGFMQLLLTGKKRVKL